MKRRIINSVQRMLPNKGLRREKFSQRLKNSRRHRQRYNSYSYHAPKASRFNRWDDYKRLTNRYY